jgi:hypothetical protein
MKYLAAQAKHEKAAAKLKSCAEGLGSIRKRATDQTGLLEVKTREAEELRAKKAVDDVSILFCLLK